MNSLKASFFVGSGGEAAETNEKTSIYILFILAALLLKQIKTRVTSTNVATSLPAGTEGSYE
jgi:hypothetical protein